MYVYIIYSFFIFVFLKTRRRKSAILLRIRYWHFISGVSQAAAEVQRRDCRVLAILILRPPEQKMHHVRGTNQLRRKFTSMPHVPETLLDRLALTTSSQGLERSEYRKKLDWESPICAVCLRCSEYKEENFKALNLSRSLWMVNNSCINVRQGIQEKSDYEQWQKEREEEAAKERPVALSVRHCGKQSCESIWQKSS